MKTQKSIAFRKKGFTLVEVLTSMAVLSIMLVIWASMFRMATSTWSEGRKKTDLNTKARLMFDMIGRDLKAGIFRPDLPAFVDEAGEFDYAFYSKKESEDSESRKVSVLRYYPETNAWFYRQSSGISWNYGWEDMGFMTNVIPALTNTEYALKDKQKVLKGVVRMEMAFVTTKSTTFPDPENAGYYANRYFTGCKNIVVTLALMDDMTMDVLGNKVADFTGASSRMLPRMDEGEAYSNNVTYYNGSPIVSPQTLSIFDKTHRARWDVLMNQSSYYDDYPRQVRTGMKVFERYYTIDLPKDSY